MHTRAQSHRPILGVSWNPCHVALTILTTLLSLMFIFLFLTVTAQPAQGQTFRVLHDFTGQADGELPFGTPMVDTAGNVYGTAWAASRPCPGCPSRGPIYRLRLADSGWLFSIIANVEGVFVTGLSHDRQDVFYGTDANDGSFPGGVFKLNPQPGKPFPILGQWMATFLYEFRGGDDGNSPNDLTIDPQGDLYGTTTWGGVYGWRHCFQVDTCSRRVDI